MTTREASEVLASCGLELRPDAVKRLVERDGGLAVGLYLAGLSLAGRGEAEAALADFHGDDRLVVDYMRDVFLSGLDRDTLDFLIADVDPGPAVGRALRRRARTDRVRRRCFAGSCDRTCWSSRSTDAIAPTATTRCSARCCDRSCFGPTPRWRPSLHTRASAWYRERGDVDRAVVHAIEAGDRDLAGEPDLGERAEYASSGRHATVRGWLANFSDAQLARLAAALPRAGDGAPGGGRRGGGRALDGPGAGTASGRPDRRATTGWWRRPRGHPRGRRGPRGCRQHVGGRDGRLWLAVRATARGARSAA